MINCPECGAEIGDDMTVCPECGVGEKYYFTLKTMPDAMRRTFFMIEDDEGIEFFKTLSKENIKVFLGDYGTIAAVPVKKGFSIMPKYTIKFDDEDIIVKQTMKSYTTTWGEIASITEERHGYLYKFKDRKGNIMATMSMKNGGFRVAIETYSTDFRLMCIMAIIAEGMHKIRMSRPAGI